MGQKLLDMLISFFSKEKIVGYIVGALIVAGAGWAGVAPDAIKAGLCKVSMPSSTIAPVGP